MLGGVGRVDAGCGSRVVHTLPPDEEIAAPLRQLSYIVVLEGHQARLLHVVDGEEAALAVHVLLRNDEEALIRRQLHAGNLLHLRRDHDEIDLADVRLA